jgi:excisionase family DNA binding protein
MKRTIRPISEIIALGGFMRVDEVAAVLQISIPTVYSYAKKKLLPCIKLPMQGVRFDPLEIQAWVDTHRAIT